MKNKSGTINFLLLFLIAFSIFSLLLGYFRIKSYIYGPFSVSKKTFSTAKEEELLLLKKRDTDSDGLNDFDEMYLYKTSIYLEDSDSDTFSDKEEVEAKTNPLNPESTPVNKRIITESPIEELVLKPASLKEEITPQEIRDILINKGGLSKEFVDKIDDNTLLRLYNETKKELGFGFKDLEKNGPFNLGLGTENPLAIINSIFQNFDAKEIRELLISAGIEKELLDKIDDQTLKNLFSEILKQIK
jgi:hypothetical protein